MYAKVYPLELGLGRTDGHEPRSRNVYHSVFGKQLVQGGRW